MKQETLVYGMVGLTGGEEAAREYHDGLEEDGDGGGAFHLAGSHGARHAYVYDPTLTRDDHDPTRYRPPSLTTDIVNVRLPNTRFFRVVPPAKGSEDGGEFNVLLLVGGRVDCFIETRRSLHDRRLSRGYFVDGAVAWGHTQTGDEFPEFTGKTPRRFWERAETDRTLHVQRCGAGVLFLRRRMLDRDGEPSHLRTSIVTIRAYWRDRDSDKDDLLAFETRTFHMDAPASAGRYYDPSCELFEAPFRRPLERAIAVYGEYCSAPSPTRRPYGLRSVKLAS
ncbi:MAG: hypothetical protein AAB570_02550 [Patescibacteria group bacterium]